jgi:hypothetical protein
MQQKMILRTRNAGGDVIPDYFAESEALSQPIAGGKVSTCLLLGFVVSILKLGSNDVAWHL